MRAQKQGAPPSKDDPPYGEIYRLLRKRQVLATVEPARAEEGKPMRWHGPELVRMLKRLGAVPQGHNAKRAAFRVAFAVSEMARGTGSGPEEVYVTLVRHCRSRSEEALCVARPRCGECPVTPYCAHAQKRPTIKDLPETERPRERLLSIGERSLSNAELLAILIRGGSKEESALALAQRLLTKFGSLHALAEAGNKEIQTKGLGKAKLTHIRAAIELGRRLATEPVQKGPIVRGSDQVFNRYGERLKDLKKELFLCLLLDTKHNIILEDQIAEGSLDETIVHPREVFKRAIKESAAAVLFVHNHPSGNPDPSAQDKRLTQRLCEVGNIMGIRVLDHIIIGKDGYYSFAEHGGVSG